MGNEERSEVGIAGENDQGHVKHIGNEQTGSEVLGCVAEDVVQKDSQRREETVTPVLLQRRRCYWRVVKRSWKDYLSTMEASLTAGVSIAEQVHRVLLHNSNLLPPRNL